MFSENSEDALTWNIFRYLENIKLSSSLLDEISNNNHKIIDVIYWSFLKNARIEFGESVRGSEPDIIIQTDKTLFIIEAKSFSPNRTSGYKETLEKRFNNSKKYSSGGNNLFDSLFTNDYKSVVIDQKYELMRFWILGNWIAQKLNLEFHLINLVLKNRELNIESDFGKHIVSNSNKTFSRYTWNQSIL